MKFTFQICIRYSFENAYIAHFGNMINLKNPKLHKNKPEEEICYPLPADTTKEFLFAMNQSTCNSPISWLCWCCSTD